MKRYSLFMVILSLILVAGLTQGCSDKASPTEPAELRGEITSETAPSAALDTYRAIPIPDIAVSPTSLDFGSVEVVDHTRGWDHRGDKFLYLSVENTGTATLVISKIKIGNPDTVAFHIHRYMSSGACLRENTPTVEDGITYNVTLRPSEVCAFSVAFLPSAATYFDSYLSIRSNDPNEGTVRVGLRGRGTNLRLGDIPRFEIDPRIPTPR